MFNTTPPRRVLKLANKKKSATDAVVQNRSNTCSNSGQHLNYRKPRSSKVCQPSAIHHRYCDAVDGVPNFETTCRGYNCKISFQFSNLLGKNLKSYIGSEEKNETLGQNVIVKINVIGSPQVGKTSLIQRLRGDASSRKTVVALDGQPMELVFHETDIRLQQLRFWTIYKMF
ncbi:uncharacterized protein LOC133204780 [Saccostrea echinata]|uniref:uncharacterized protein LOC133204780 n=1 Tax=Saccostrea echinata TaxID=191078 RepID=UPI002A7FF5B5|nr:uncharacterized protein LOC133204780 [Saccostrea echinata]